MHFVFLVIMMMMIETKVKRVSGPYLDLGWVSQREINLWGPGLPDDILRRMKERTTILCVEQSQEHTQGKRGGGRQRKGEKETSWKERSGRVKMHVLRDNAVDVVLQRRANIFCSLIQMLDTRWHTKLSYGPKRF